MLWRPPLEVYHQGIRLVAIPPCRSFLESKYIERVNGVEHVVLNVTMAAHVKIAELDVRTAPTEDHVMCERYLRRCSKFLSALSKITPGED